MNVSPLSREEIRQGLGLLSIMMIVVILATLGCIAVIRYNKDIKASTQTEIVETNEVERAESNEISDMH